MDKRRQQRLVGDVEEGGEHSNGGHNGTQSSHSEQRFGVQKRDHRQDSRASQVGPDEHGAETETVRCDTRQRTEY